MRKYMFTTPDGARHERLSIRHYTDVLVARPSLEYDMLVAQNPDRGAELMNWAFMKSMSKTPPNTAVIHDGKRTLVIADEKSVADAKAFIEKYPTADVFVDWSKQANLALIEQRVRERYYDTYLIVEYFLDPRRAADRMIEMRSLRLWDDIRLIDLEVVDA